MHSPLSISTAARPLVPLVLFALSIVGFYLESEFIIVSLLGILAVFTWYLTLNGKLISMTARHLDMLYTDKVYSASEVEFRNSTNFGSLSVPFLFTCFLFAIAKNSIPVFLMLCFVAGGDVAVGFWKYFHDRKVKKAADGDPK
ncbi:hypothetical protein DFR52_102177 [Hoeflea marina]|uniref:Uncharacterized protein n=1 Tax=Hoeflea marina TaxID=274592 RepID=A0A317PKN5_9HYPH|nr:hypothetical protein [Hoeflea marina]PWW01515.1 hypothetical protein DFR52_102177 [Hoeflea marina]